MKNYKPFLLATIFTIAIGISTLSGQTNYSSTKDGKWDKDNNFPNWIGQNDTIFIDHDITLNIDFEMAGVLYVSSNGSISGNKNIIINSGGEINADNNLSFKELQIGGSLTINGDLTVDKINAYTSADITVNGNLDVSNSTNISNSSLSVQGSANFGNHVSLNTGSTVDIQSGPSTIDGKLDLHNASSLTSGDELTITHKIEATGGSEIINNGTLTTDREIKLYGGSTLQNGGTLTTSGSIINQGEIINMGLWTAEGDINNQNGFIANGGQFDLNATLNNHGGNLETPGTITASSAGSINNSSGTIEGLNQGDICKDDGTTNPIVGGDINNVNNVDICGVSDDQTYPIELVGFEVKKEGNSVQVIWSTATEINNDYFTIERAAGNQDFKAIGTVQGAGNSNQTLNYSYTDNDAPNGEQLYYRIKQTDYDGSYSYSWIQNVNIENNVTVNVYPNPVQRGQNIMIQSSEDNLLLNLYDAQGNKVRSSNLNHNQNKIETSDLNPGLYFIRLQNSYDETTVTRKLIIQ